MLLMLIVEIKTEKRKNMEIISQGLKYNSTKS